MLPSVLACAIGIGVCSDRKHRLAAHVSYSTISAVLKLLFIYFPVYL